MDGAAADRATHRSSFAAVDGIRIVSGVAGALQTGDYQLSAAVAALVQHTPPCDP